MYPRTNYEMTEDDLKALVKAAQPVPCLLIGGNSPRSPQENVNRAWQLLGSKMWFDYMTVKPINGKGQRFFTAVPNETAEQKEERVKNEAEEKRLVEIEQLKGEISERQDKLAGLEYP